jgi:hypothetical protein
MRTVSAAAAVLALFLAVAFPLVLGGVIFALFLFFPLFLLALAGVLDTVEDRTVARRDPRWTQAGGVNASSFGAGGLEKRLGADGRSSINPAKPSATSSRIRV